MKRKETTTTKNTKREFKKNSERKWGKKERKFLK